MSNLCTARGSRTWAILAFFILTAGCKVYESKGPEANTGSDLTPICHAGN